MREDDPGLEFKALPVPTASRISPVDQDPSPRDLTGSASSSPLSPRGLPQSSLGNGGMDPSEGHLEPKAVPEAAAPPRRLGRGAFVLITVAAALLSLAVGATVMAMHTRSGTPRTASVSAAGSALSAPGAIVAVDGAVLLARVLPAPAGTKSLTVPGTTGGLMNLDQFVQKVFPRDPVEKARLQAMRFQVAVQRAWIDTDDGIEVGIDLIRFGVDAGAAQYVQAEINWYYKDPIVTGFFPVPGVGYGMGFDYATVDSYGLRTAVLICQAGPLVAVITVYTSGALDRTADISLMQRQLAALGDHP